MCEWTLEETDTEQMRTCETRGWGVGWGGGRFMPLEWNKRNLRRQNIAKKPPVKVKMGEMHHKLA